MGRIAAHTQEQVFEAADKLAANGQEVTDPAMIECEPEAFANPGALLLDDIRVYR